MNDWKKLDSIVSKGSTVTKASTLGGLHAKRQETLSQYFTPSWIVEFAWKSIEHCFNAAGVYGLFDNSVGSASMFRFADPEKHYLTGFDIDEALVNETSLMLSELGFDADVICADMSAVNLGRFSVSMINPPYSIPLDSPYLRPYEGVTHYGRHGENTSAMSDEYAVAQALEASNVVCAVVPRRVTKLFREIEPRLEAIYKLPADCFASETVKTVGVDLLIFGRKEAKQLVERKIDINSTVNGELDHLSCVPFGVHSYRASAIGVENVEPVIDGQITLDNRVEMFAQDRSISLVFHDAATEGKVLNRIYQRTLTTKFRRKIPKNIKYSGEFKLNLDVIVLQDDPWAALKEVCRIIAMAGGIPIVSDQLKEKLSSMIVEHQNMTIPYSRTVYRKGAPSITGTARKLSTLNRYQRGAVVKRGDEVVATRADNGFEVRTSAGLFECAHDQFFDIFEVDEDALSEGYWEEIHPPIEEKYPREIAQLRERANQLGVLDWLTWSTFQQVDLLEVAFREKGGIVGWQMALGKTRLALALGLLLEGRSLIVVKSRLVPELQNELRKLKVDSNLYKIIRSENDVCDLRKLNIISYNKNKADIRGTQDILADRLRGKIENVIADEGGLLSKEHSLQTKAVWALGTQKNYIFDGTPMPNYARECLSLAEWAIGSAVSYQPYSSKGIYLTKELFNDGEGVLPGRDAFHDHYACIEWATNEFVDTGKGAKREMPKIKAENIGMFRDWLSPIIKRRVQQEPAVAVHCKFPIPILHEPTVVEWDTAHLKLYIEAVEKFKQWYVVYAKERFDNAKALNLTVILQQLEACFKAANAPHLVSGFASPYTQLTSKQVAVLDHVEELVSVGRRPIVFARTPAVLNRLGQELDKRGISHIVFTGEKTIEARTKELDEKIRNGDAEVMLAGINVTQDGLNLANLDSFIFYNRDFRAIAEFQAIYRLLRCDQEKEVHGYWYHLSGSVDEYMAQMVEWKSMAAEAGLDYGEQPDDDEFVHFNAFFYRFMNSHEDLQKLLSRKIGKAA